MKNKSIMVIALLGVMLTAACKKEDKPVVNPPQPNPIEGTYQWEVLDGRVKYTTGSLVLLDTNYTGLIYQDVIQGAGGSSFITKRFLNTEQTTRYTMSDGSLHYNAYDGTFMPTSNPLKFGIYVNPVGPTGPNPVPVITFENGVGTYTYDIEEEFADSNKAVIHFKFKLTR